MATYTHMIKLDRCFVCVWCASCMCQIIIYVSVCFVCVCVFIRDRLHVPIITPDCENIKGSHITDEEIRGAEEKFAESLHAAQMGMFNLLENDVSFERRRFWECLIIDYFVCVFQVEQVSQLVTFSEGLLDYHQQCTEVLKILCETLQEK